MSGINDMTATATIAGGTCAVGQAITITVNPTNVTDVSTNIATGPAISETYTIN